MFTSRLWTRRLALSGIVRERLGGVRRRSENREIASMGIHIVGRMLQKGLRGWLEGWGWMMLHGSFWLEKGIRKVLGNEVGGNMERRWASFQFSVFKGMLNIISRALPCSSRV